MPAREDERFFPTVLEAETYLREHNYVRTNEPGVWYSQDGMVGARLRSTGKHRDFYLEYFA